MCSASASSIHIYYPKCPLPCFLGDYLYLVWQRSLCVLYLWAIGELSSIWWFFVPFYSKLQDYWNELPRRRGFMRWFLYIYFFFSSAGINKYCVLQGLLRGEFLGESLIYLFLIPHNSVWVIKLLFLLEIVAVEAGTPSSRPGCSKLFLPCLCLDFVHIASAVNSWLWGGVYLPTWCIRDGSGHGEKAGGLWYAPKCAL